MTRPAADAFPLAWPAAWPRTPEPRRARAAFQCTFSAARDGVLREIERTGGRWPVISTDQPLRRDGVPYAPSTHRAPADPGVAVYFELKGRQLVLACDRWEWIEHNLRAIEKTLEALRGIERWGTSEVMDRAFAGFKRLPHPDQVSALSWHQVLGFPWDAKPTLEQARSAYLERARKHHPDHGGNATDFQAITDAWTAAQRDLGTGP